MHSVEFLVTEFIRLFGVIQTFAEQAAKRIVMVYFFDCAILVYYYTVVTLMVFQVIMVTDGILG